MTTEIMCIDDVLAHLYRGIRHAQLNPLPYSATVCATPPSELAKHVRLDIAVCAVQRLSEQFEAESNDRSLVPRHRAVSRTAAAMLAWYASHLLEHFAASQAEVAA